MPDPDVGQYRLERNDIFQMISNREWFIPCMAAHYMHGYGQFRLDVDVSRHRLSDAFHFYIDDLYRVGEIELGGGDPDHFKRAAHLAYWLRRSTPVVKITMPDRV